MPRSVFVWKVPGKRTIIPGTTTTRRPAKRSKTCEPSIEYTIGTSMAMCFDPNTDFTDMEFTEQELSVAVIESSTIGSIEGGSRVAFRCFTQDIGLLKGSYLLRSLISKRKSARICCQTVPWFQRQLRIKSQAWSLYIAYRFLLLESISGRSPENDLYSSNHLEKMDWKALF